MCLQVSVESPRGLRSVLKHVYTSPPISELDFYTPRPALESENEDGEIEHVVEKGIIDQRYINV